MQGLPDWTMLIDQDPATTNTIEDNWEEMLLSRAKTGDSHELD